MLVRFAISNGVIILLATVASHVANAQTPGSELKNLPTNQPTVKALVSDSLKTMDSLQVAARLDSVSTKLNDSIDSLKNLNLPAEEYCQKVDNLFATARSGVTRMVNARTDSLDAKTEALVAQYKGKLTARQQRVDSLLTAHKLKAPVIDVAELDNLSMPAVGSAEFSQPGLPAISLPPIRADLPTVDKLLDADVIPDDLPEVKTTISNAGERADEVKAYTDRVQEVKTVDVQEEVKKLPGTIEKEVQGLEPVKAVTNELPSKALAEGHVAELKSLTPDVENIQGEVKKRTQRQVKDYFAGKDETINNALAKVEKLQKHYSTVADMRKLPARKPNTMKGKPLHERFVPGVLLQVKGLESPWKQIDVSPNMSFWFHQKFRAGAAGIYRLNLNTKKFQATAADRVYGFRTYGNYKVHKSFFVHLEGEMLRLNKPPGLPASEAVRAWNYSLNTGLFKTYKINKFTRGTTVVLYDLLNMDESFNFNRLAVRFGLEFTLKRKPIAYQ